MNIEYSRISFASDNCAPVHPKVMEALIQANQGYAPSYGADPWTKALTPALDQLFGRPCYPFLMPNGTGANVAAMAHVMRGYTSVICASVCHMNTDETAAPERVAGVKLLPVATPDGKLVPKQIEQFLRMKGNEHCPQPTVVAITQTTELGTVYTREEVKAIAQICRQNGLLLYMDGSRVGNAAVHLNADIRDITCDAGVDIVCLGGTKQGLMYGECVVFFDKTLADFFLCTRKSTGQLCSKMRFMAAQFLALLEKDLWRENARHANECAQYLAKEMEQVAGFHRAFPVEANELFFTLDTPLAEALQKRYDFVEHDGFWRMVTSFETKRENIDEFVAYALELGRSV